MQSNQVIEGVLLYLPFLTGRNVNVNFGLTASRLALSGVVNWINSGFFVVLK